LAERRETGGEEAFPRDAGSPDSAHAEQTFLIGSSTEEDGLAIPAGELFAHALDDILTR